MDLSKFTDTRRAWLMKASAALIICFPFNVYLPVLAFASLVVGSVGILLSAPRYPRPPVALAVSALVVFIYLFVGIVSGRSLRASATTSTHMVQMMLCTYAFYTAFYNEIFEEGELGWFVAPVAVGHLIAVVLTILGVGSWGDDDNVRPAFTEHNTLTFFLTFLLLTRIDSRRRLSTMLILSSYMVALWLFTDRASVHALSLCVIALIFVRPPPIILVAISAVIILFPIYFALSATSTELVAMANLNYRNTFIRVEFLRSAYSLFSRDLINHLCFGMGFGTDFRTTNFNYVRQHPLLTDPANVAAVSNHNSIFDVYFRFGLFFGTVFLWPIIRQFYIKSRARAPKAGILFLAFGLSFNAYLDNELEVSLVSFIVALLLWEQYIVRRNSTSRPSFTSESFTQRAKI